MIAMTTTSQYVASTDTPHTPGVPGQSSFFHSSFLKRTTDITRSHERPKYVAKYSSGSHRDGHGILKNTTHTTQGPSFKIGSTLGEENPHLPHTIASREISFPSQDLQPGGHLITHISIQEIISSQAQCGFPSIHVTVHNI
ncbi:hypothetical protein Nepgr_023218 [Nepenthes gracilis]|uniref:Uncharacterized protein n=1 Tax=Nepenthes gracilis TaxID=150966 RepID=A0AAD3XZ64_NEPGR|nr:hypothetical protein Nepgr_023218 [Nepenthes gracilis]